jgi:hypothetical protein
MARGAAVEEDYNDHHYHQPSDEWQASWDWSGLVQDAELVHQVGLGLANSREWPNWSADSEFRATRDATAAERGETAPAPPPPASAPRPGERG